jgi:hypothetical protein
MQWHDFLRAEHEQGRGNFALPANNSGRIMRISGFVLKRKRCVCVEGINRFTCVDGLIFTHGD